jgi:cobalt/nickel transport protein
MANQAMTKKKIHRLNINVILILLVVGITVTPLLMMKGAAFGGADVQAEKAIMEINADYEPWFSPLFKPASAEIESLLFALQAGIGGGVLGYGLGYLRGRKRRSDTEKENVKH